MLVLPLRVYGPNRSSSRGQEAQPVTTVPSAAAGSQWVTYLLGFDFGVEEVQIGQNRS